MVGDHMGILGAVVFCCTPHPTPPPLSFPPFLFPFPLPPLGCTAGAGGSPPDFFVPRKHALASGTSPVSNGTGSRQSVFRERGDRTGFERVRHASQSGFESDRLRRAPPQRGTHP